MKKNNRGFTLIELLVVIAIIGLLASIVLAGTANTRSRAKAALALNQMKELEAAFELYKSDVGEYPKESTTFWPEYYSYYFGSAGDGITPYIGALMVPKYINKLPLTNADDTTDSGKYYFGYVTGAPNLSSGAAKCGGKNMKSYMFIFLAGGNGANLPDPNVTNYARLDSNTSLACFGI